MAVNRDFGSGAWDFRSSMRRIPVCRTLAALAAGVALGMAGAAHAAMNFCAAPGLQSSESTSDEPTVQALTRRVDAHLNEAPHPLAQWRTPQPDTAPEPALDDLELMRDAALAWRVTNRAPYLALADRYLSAWTSTAQPAAPLDDTRLAGLILAYDMTASVLPIETRNGASAFIAKLGNAYAQQAPAQRTPGAAQSRRVELVALAAFTLGDRTLMKDARSLYFEQLGSGFGANGQPAAPGLRNAVDTLEPLVMAALAARRFDRNLLRARAANGVTLAAALDWLAPYATGKRTPAAWPTSDTANPADTAATQQDAAKLYYLAARLDGRYTRIAARIAAQPPAWIAACLPLAAASSLRFPQ